MALLGIRVKWLVRGKTKIITNSTKLLQHKPATSSPMLTLVTADPTEHKIERKVKAHYVIVNLHCTFYFAN